MADEMMLMFNDDGVAHIYDETYDIVIHCESAEEQKEVEKRLMEMSWIPCSERFPEECGDYLVTKKTTGWNCEEYQTNDIAYYDRDGFHKADAVIAWMPLPEPWEGEQP